MSGTETPATARKRKADCLKQLRSDSDAYNPVDRRRDIQEGSWIAVADWNQLQEFRTGQREVHYASRVLERISGSKIRIQYAGFEAVQGQGPFEIDLGDLRVCTAKSDLYLMEFVDENPKQPIPDVFLTKEDIEKVLLGMPKILGARRKSSNPSYNLENTHPIYDVPSGIEYANWKGKYGKYGPEGQGILTYLDTHNGEERMFVGICQRGNLHFGDMTFRDGTAYHGHFRNDKMHGRGKSTSAAGDVYDGDYEDGLRHGQGRLTEVNGRISTGAWVRGQQTGFGEATRNGERYVGHFINGKQHGTGRHTFVDGAVYDGAWARDSENGKGTLTLPARDGQPPAILSCRWKNGNPLPAKAVLRFGVTVLLGEAAVARYDEMERLRSDKVRRPSPWWRPWSRPPTRPQSALSL